MRSALALLALTGCGGTSFTGDVVDHAGAPIPDALVTVVGSLCQAKTDAAGHFELGCNSAKGDTTLSVGQTGYVSVETQLTVGEPVAYPAGTLTLVGIPEGEGLFLRTGATYDQPKRGFLVKATVETRDEFGTTFCVKSEGAPVFEAPAGTLTVFDKGHEGWRLWIVGDDGCVYKKRRIDRGEWERTFGDKLDPTNQRDVGQEQSISTFELTKGRYWLGEWSNGFFAPDESIDGDRVHYGGYVLEID